MGFQPGVWLLVLAPLFPEVPEEELLPLLEEGLDGPWQFLRPPFSMRDVGFTPLLGGTAE